MEKNKMLSVASGEIIALSSVPDKLFSQKMLGEGFAVNPTSGSIFSPVDGIISGVVNSLHAYTIISNDGLEILIHIGIDTVYLNGKGFLSKVEAGDRVKKGDEIAQADLKYIEENGYKTVVSVFITNVDVLEAFEITKGTAIGGQSIAMEYNLK